MRRAAPLVLACAGVAVGIGAEAAASAWRDVGTWLPDLLAGWILIGLGIALFTLRRHGASALLLVAGFTWFAFNFRATGPHALQWVAARTAYVHRAPLLQLALAPPAGRPRTLLATAGVALAWATAVVWPSWDDDYAALLLSTVFVALAAVSVRSGARRSRALALRGLVAVSVLGIAVGADALRSIAGTSQSATDATVLGYAAAVAVGGTVLFTAALLDAPALLAERAVALERGGARLRDALRDLLGDPTLEVGFAVAPGVLVDDAGRPVAPPHDGRVVTRVTVAQRELGVIVHHPATLEDAPTRAAVFAAVGLAAERARLRVEVDRQTAAVEASRRRLLVAEEDERRRLADQIERGPGGALAGVARLVDAVRARARRPELREALDRASAQLVNARPELDALVRGLGGVDASGLVPALRRLDAALPFDVELELADVHVAPQAATALWFVCSEALANVVKHADARTVRVSLHEHDGTARLTVADDGRGGARADGSGIVGLADRIAALGGRLDVVSPPGGGTRVVAELPLQ